MAQTNYRQLSELERHAISLALQQGMSQRAIARALGRSPSTISRECKRNSGALGYTSNFAQQRCERRRRFSRPPSKLHREGVAGFSRDIVKVFATYSRNNALANSRLIYGEQINQTFRNMKNTIKAAWLS